MARILAKSMFNRIRKPSRGEDFRQVAAFGASNPGRKLVCAVSEVGPMKIEDRHCQDGRTFLQEAWTVSYPNRTQYSYNSTNNFFFVSFVSQSHHYIEIKDHT